MKTVMKKMFSLLLVAVMLIGIMPFAAFAEGTNTVNVQVFVNNTVNAGNFSATFDQAPDLNSLKAQAEGLVGSYTGATFSGWADMGDSTIVDAKIIQNGWTIKANFSAPYCSSCGQYGHATGDPAHCACGYYVGHRESCTAGCKNDYTCDWTFAHLSTCTHGKCAVCNQATHEGTCCSECKALNGAHTDTCTSGCKRGYDCTWTKKHKDDCNYKLCATCGNEKHGNIPCCAECKNSTGGHETTCTSGCTKNGSCTWGYAHHNGCLSQHKCSVCEQFGHLEENCPSTPCDQCDGTVTEHTRSCPTLLNNTCKVKVHLNLNYGNAYGYGENIGYVWADKNELLKDVVADLAEPTRDGHYFQYWTTRDGTVIDVYNTEDRATADGVMIYAQWVDIIQSDSGTVDVTVDLMYGDLKDYIKNIVPGVKMGNVLEYAGIPVRLNHKFLGWYWDSKYTKRIDSEQKIYQDCTIYAKWEYRDTSNDILLKVYLNDNTHTPVRTIDMYKYTRDDGYISLSEVKEAVKLYYTAKDTDGMYFEGLYNSDTWLSYVENQKTAKTVGSIEMEYEPGVDTIVYVMVKNAKARTYTASTSSSTTYKADSSNPKTGDAIYAPIMIMGASVSALAVLYYLNKKRAY